MEIKANARPEEKLLSAVIALAIDDACLPPIKIAVRGGKKVVVMSHHAFTAYRFLFFDGDGYYAALDMDPSEFKRRLMSQMTDLNTSRPFDTVRRNIDIIGRRKRMFKLNHKLYVQNRFRGNFVEEPNNEQEEKEDDDND